MAAKDEERDLFSANPPEFVIDGVVLPADHSIYKLFPGKTYRLAKAMRETGHAFLDINGLNDLVGSPSEWSDDALLRLITLDRIGRQSGASRPSAGKRKKRSGSEQDKKRLGFLKTLFFTAKKGDLVVVPLGEGYDGKIVVGELVGEPGDVNSFSHEDDDGRITTYGRRVTWVAELRRDSLSPALVKSILSPTALHLIGSSFQEELYVGVYGTFAYGDVYVAKFETDKERLGAQDYANIGVMFNGLAVAHDSEFDVDLASTKRDQFYAIAIEHHGSATIEFRRNSPISAIVRTIGPLAFTAAVMVSGAAEGKSLAELKSASVVARPIGAAKDRCHIEVPPDLETTAIGLGKLRYDTFCSVHQKVQSEAHVRSPARLKKASKTSKQKT